MLRQLNNLVHLDCFIIIASLKKGDNNYIIIEFINIIKIKLRQLDANSKFDWLTKQSHCDLFQASLFLRALGHMTLTWQRMKLIYDWIKRKEAKQATEKDIYIYIIIVFINVTRGYNEIEICIWSIIFLCDM